MESAKFTVPTKGEIVHRTVERPSSFEGTTVGISAEDGAHAFFTQHEWQWIFPPDVFLLSHKEYRRTRNLRLPIIRVFQEYSWDLKKHS